MERLHPLFTMRTSLSFLLLILFQMSSVAVAERICSSPISVEFPENNTVGQVITSITVKSGVTLTFGPSSENPNPFMLEGNQLVAAKVFDYESGESPVADIICTETATGLEEKLPIVVVLININDNPPVFNENPYRINVYEMSPVGTSVGHFAATDLDKPNQLYYRLTSEANEFELRSPTDPDLLVKTPLEYDKVKNVRLVLTAQDTPLTRTETGPFTATTTILVNILDSDNRPPWFQPCTMHNMGGTKICQSTGYTGRVVLNEQETGVLPLKPGPLYAIDGDSGINEEITYSFLSGNNENLFEINGNTGNISMLKPAHKLDSIILTVLAAQRNNSHQFATTTVTISVQEKSNNPPRFQRLHYEGIITAVGSMAMDLEDKDKPLQILATDDDYTTTGGINPYITYSITGSSDFSIIDGRLFMTNHLPEDILSLQVVANDTSNDEIGTAQLMVEVKTGLTTTGLPLSTTDIMTTTATAESTTDSKTTSNPSMTSEGNVSTASTAQPATVILPSGAYGWVEMVALGATLGALLLISLVVIGVLAHCLRRDKADWRKIYETNMFRSSLGQGAGGPKEGIQYTNEAFQNDEDDQSMGSGGPEGGSRMAGREPQKAMEDHMRTEAIMKSSAPLHSLLLPDNTSQASSDKTDSDQEVKPILTKERRIEEGYKSVWFKEDIDPNAKEEVVIIPDSREDDSEEEDAEQSSSRREEGEYEDPPVKSPKVVFGDADLDSGLGVKMGDSAEDSDGDQALTYDL